MAAYVVCGLGFGDEGKGHTVAWLTEKLQANTIIRYNGGPQAAHNVMHRGRRHLFAQFGAGMAVSPTATTFLSQQMAIAPFNLLKEAEVHAKNGIVEPLERLKIDGRCPVVTLWHKIINRAQEMHRGKQRVGSTGMGVGATLIYQRQHPALTIMAWDMVEPSSLAQKVDALYQYMEQHLQTLADMPAVTRYLEEQAAWLQPQRLMNALTQVGQKLAPCILSASVAESYLESILLASPVLLEGAQGTLLDYAVGTIPHVTQSTPRCCAAAQLLAPYQQQIDVTYIGISRPYTHRHGAGPLPTEFPDLEPYLRDRHNLENRWQGGFRVGWFDAFLADYAQQVNPELDYLVITNLDRLANCPTVFMSSRYRDERSSQESLTDFLWRAEPVYETVPLKDVTAYVESAYSTPLLAVSAGEENQWTTVRKLVH